MITIDDIAEAFKASPNEELQALGRETQERRANAKQYEHPVEFMTTENSPHRWSSGPIMSYLNSETMRTYQSLTEARDEAETRSIGGYSENRRETTFGIVWKVS